MEASRGSRLASRLPWEMATPFGSAVVPEVKTSWARSERGRAGGLYGADPWGERGSARSAGIRKEVEEVEEVEEEREGSRSRLATIRRACVSRATRRANSG